MSEKKMVVLLLAAVANIAAPMIVCPFLAGNEHRVQIAMGCALLCGAITVGVFFRAGILGGK